MAPSSLIKGDPYFLTRQFEVGSLRINGITYPEVPLIYDIYRDQLVTFHPIFNQKILIKPEKIDGFTLSKGQLFRYFSGNESFIHHGNGISKRKFYTETIWGKQRFFSQDLIYLIFTSKLCRKSKN